MVIVSVQPWSSVINIETVPPFGTPVTTTVPPSATVVALRVPAPKLVSVKLDPSTDGSPPPTAIATCVC